MDLKILRQISAIYILILVNAGYFFTLAITLDPTHRLRFGTLLQVLTAPTVVMALAALIIFHTSKRS